MVRAVFALLLLLIGPPAFAQSFPPLTGRVVDQADLLDPAQEQALVAKSEALERGSGHQLVIATVASLEGREIEPYANALFRAWKLGGREKDDGVLLLVAPNERKVRIEVGYGLEPVLTDALSSLIVRRQILPRFKAGDMPGGIVAGADAVAGQIGLPPDQAAARQQQLLSESQRKSEGGGVPLILIFWIVVLVIFVLPMIFGGRRGRKYRGGRGPVVIWGPPSSGSGWGSSSGGSSWGGGGFSGGGGSSGGGGASGSW
jgi:uncharacterized protein